MVFSLICVGFYRSFNKLMIRRVVEDIVSVGLF